MRIYLLIILTACILFSQAQKKSKNIEPTEREYQQKLEDERCVFKRKFSDNELMSQFPFDQAKTIRLISFDFNKYDPGIIHKFYHVDSMRNYYLDSIKIDTNNWKEVIRLDTSKFRSLANLMFNYAPFKISNYPFDVVLQCYWPKNAIVFYNKCDEIFAVIDICFDCEKMGFFPHGFKLDYDCTDKFELFRKFFLQNGIKYGTMPTN